MLQWLGVGAGVLTGGRGRAAGSGGGDKADIVELAARHLDLLDVG